MAMLSFGKGRGFESEVESLLRALVTACPKRVSFKRQQQVSLRDGRTKFLDFALDYETISSKHMVGIECQHRDSWSSEILDKIIAIRNNSFRNRFWFVYKDGDFLSPESRSVLGTHGIMHFSHAEFALHLKAVEGDLHAAEKWVAAQPSGIRRDPPSDPAMLSGRSR